MFLHVLTFVTEEFVHKILDVYRHLQHLYIIKQFCILLLNKPEALNSQS
jgi:hypothetical protein